MIKKVEISSDNKIPWVMSFGQKNVIHSSNKNSMGKTTVIRSILFGFGFIEKPNFVDGTFIKGFRVKIDYESKNGVWRFVRDKNNLMIQNLDKKSHYLQESFEIKNAKDIDKALQFISPRIFNVKSALIVAALFSNYVDQQYGNHTINRTQESIFPKNLRFDINTFANEYNEDLKEIAMLKEKKRELDKYKKDLEMIKKNTIPIDNNLSLFDVINSKQVELRDLELKLENYKRIASDFTSKKQILAFFDHNLEELGLVFKDNDGNFKPLTKDNFKESTAIQNKIFDEKLKHLENQINELKNEIQTREKNISINKKTLENFERTKHLVASLNALKRRITIEELNSWEEISRKTMKEISDAQDISKSKMWLKLEADIRKYLKMFADKNKILLPFVEKMENTKNLLLKDNAKFKTYVGAIRFAIMTSFRFAISDFIIKKGWNFPIIIDNLIQEEIDNDMEDVYIEILKSRREQIIISSLKKPKLIAKWDREVPLNRNLFQDASMSLFETLD